MNANTCILVVGGAGYIGSHACKALKAAGYTPVTYDNLSTGWEPSVKFGPFEYGDLNDRDRLDEVFVRWQPAAVMHFAALSQVGEAMRLPEKYWRENINASLTLIETMLAHGCTNLVFSSTCATYGEQDGVVLDEKTAQQPINAYGASKRSIEEMIAHFSAVSSLRSVIFRYFNVAGADPEAEIGECHDPETHLIPLLLDVAGGRRSSLTMFGDDYPTPDGTCVRDYVHVCDLVDAHLLGLKWLERGEPSRVFCLGSGHGFSVREVISAARAVTGQTIPITVGVRRQGDAAKLVCGSTRARAELGWQPTRSTLATMIEDTWRVHRELLPLFWNRERPQNAGETALLGRREAAFRPGSSQPLAPAAIDVGALVDALALAIQDNEQRVLDAVTKACAAGIPVATNIIYLGLRLVERATPGLPFLAATGTDAERSPRPAFRRAS